MHHCIGHVACLTVERYSMIFERALTILFFISNDVLKMWTYHGCFVTAEEVANTATKLSGIAEF